MVNVRKPVTRSTKVTFLKVPTNSDCCLPEHQVRKLCPGKPHTPCSPSQSTLRATQEAVTSPPLSSLAAPERGRGRGRLPSRGRTERGHRPCVSPPARRLAHSAPLPAPALLHTRTGVGAWVTHSLASLAAALQHRKRLALTSLPSSLFFFSPPSASYARSTG